MLLTLFYRDRPTANDKAKVTERGGRHIYEFRGFPALLVALPEAAIEAVSLNPRLEGISLSYNLALAGNFKNYSYWDVIRAGHGFEDVPELGGNVKIGIIDSGVECGHPDLVCPDGYSFSELGPYTEDDADHGTGVYSVIMAKRDSNNSYPYGYAPWAHPYMYRADARTWIPGVGWVYGIATAYAAQAVDRAVYVDSVAVITMSFSDTLVDAALEAALSEAYARGVFNVGSAGNSGADEVRYPAGYGSVMAIAGLECSGSLTLRSSYTRCRQHLRHWSGTTYGSHVELAAIARTVRVDVTGGGVAWLDGTSYSAPAVAAAAVLVIERWPNSAFKVGVIHKHLKHTAYTGTPAYDPNFMGAGVLNAEAAVNLDPCSWQECLGGPQ